MNKLKAQSLFGLEWSDALWDEINNDAFSRLTAKLQLDRLNNIIICPDKEDIFKAFRLTNLPDIKVVIIGQDPYHSILGDGKKWLLDYLLVLVKRIYSPSLRNIIKELEDDLNKLAIDFDYTMESWAKQGVLMLNTALTVQENNPGSHTEYWKSFTQKVMEVINKKTNNTVFILWGSHAQSFKNI